MKNCFFCSDLHGSGHRYSQLFRAIGEEAPRAVFIGGDLLPGSVAMLASGTVQLDFVEDVLAAGFLRLKETMGDSYPEVFIILGNDDGRFDETVMLAWESRGLWHYAHNRVFEMDSFQVYGYSFVPPTPFRLKDWEKYDVSRFVDPGCVHPEDGIHTVPVSEFEMRHSTIQDDLTELTAHRDLSRAIMLFHSPPYETCLDRAALDGIKVDHAPMDLHVGSIAIARLIRTRQPHITLHGHVHESVDLTGRWMERIGRTFMFGGAHRGPELALVKFHTEDPGSAVRVLL
jgi:Icc-related predicted phosphoesterase